MVLVPSTKGPTHEGGQIEHKQPISKIETLQQDLPAERPIAQQRGEKPLEAPKIAEKPKSGGCADWMREAGIPLTNATEKLILNESGCKPHARNPSSGACGIPQAYPCSKLKCPLNESGAVCQLTWMKNYVHERYGSWEGALSHWYSQCHTKQGCWY